MGNLGSRKKQKEDENEVTDDVWLKLNDGKKSPKGKKKKKKKRKKKGKEDSPDRFEEDTSQCDTCSYSQSTISSRKLSDSTIASAGTITHQNAENDLKAIARAGANNTDDQSNGSIGYITASDTFTPPSPRKGRQPKFSPVIAQDSPRVVRRLLQSEKILENQNESLENLSPRARFFLSTPEPSKSTKTFENRKFSRHSSGSSIDSRTILGLADDKTQQVCLERANDNRYITNGSLIVKSRQQGNKNNYGHDSRFSNNSLDMSDSTAENLVKTGEQAKMIRFDGGNMSPAERRKNKQNELLRGDPNNAAINKLPFLKYDREYPRLGIKDNFIDFIITKDSGLKAPAEENFMQQNDEETTEKTFLKTQEQEVEIVPPPTPASGVDLLEVDESEITESESCSEKHLSKDDELFGDSVCKRLSLLLESEQDSEKLNRSEFHEFTDSPSSSPEVPEIVCECETFEKFVNNDLEQTCVKPTGINDTKESTLMLKSLENSDSSRTCDFENEEILKTSNLDVNCDERPKFNSTVKTPQGKENASVLDVMNNNFKMKANEDLIVKETTQNLDCARALAICQKDRVKPEKESSQHDRDIEEQMRYENEINEKLIEERIKTLHEIFPPPNDTNKRNSLLCAINNKHANDPDNYILVTKKTYCVKRGILVELMDEEKDVITRDVIKTLNGKSDWITTGREEIYKPDNMFVEQGSKLICPTYIEEKDDATSDISGGILEPDYANLEEFERLEKEFDDASSSDEEIDFENVLNKSQSQSDSESSEARPKRESDILCDVINAYKDEDEDYSEYSDDMSDGEILYAEESQTQSREYMPNVVRTPSKLDQSLQKIFQEKGKQLSVTSPPIPNQNLDDFDVTPTAEVYDQFQAAGYDSPHHKSSDGSRRSLAYTESDLDTSEKWEDDDDASNDSMLADDEDDDDEIGEIIFSKPYLEHEEKADALFSYNMVKTMPESPVMWEPEAEDDDVFHDIPLGSSGYQAEDSLESSDEAFDDARKQMKEIHKQLQTLREQMVTFENEEEDSSLPTSPLDDRILHIPKAASD